MMAEQLSFELQAFEVSLAILITGVVLFADMAGIYQETLLVCCPCGIVAGIELFLLSNDYSFVYGGGSSVLFDLL